MISSLVWESPIMFKADEQTESLLSAILKERIHDYTDKSSKTGFGKQWNQLPGTNNIRFHLLERRVAVSVLEISFLSTSTYQSILWFKLEEKIKFEGGRENDARDTANCLDRTSHCARSQLSDALHFRWISKFRFRVKNSIPAKLGFRVWSWIQEDCRRLARGHKCFHS